MEMVSRQMGVGVWRSRLRAGWRPASGSKSLEICSEPQDGQGHLGAGTRSWRKGPRQLLLSPASPASICRQKHRQEPEGRPQGGRRRQGRAGLGECLEPGGGRVQEGVDGHG